MAVKRTTFVATVCMVLAVSLANVLHQYPMNAWMTWGTPVITLTFLINELVHQLQGPKQAQKVVVWGFVFASATSLLLAPRQIALASATAFLAAQLLDIALFAKIRPWAPWWLAPWAASTAASIVDTGLFFGLAFMQAPHVSWWRLGAGDLAVKLLVDIGLLVPFRVLMRRQRSP